MPRIDWRAFDQLCLDPKPLQFRAQLLAQIVIEQCRVVPVAIKPTLNLAWR